MLLTEITALSAGGCAATCKESLLCTSSDNNTVRCEEETVATINLANPYFSTYEQCSTFGTIDSMLVLLCDIVDKSHLK